MICCGLTLSVIRKFPITEFLLAKRKRYNSTLNLTLMTVIIYTGNKVKSNRGEEKKKGFNWIFLFWSAYNIRENILHLVDIIGENVPKFCTFVTDRKQVNFIEDAILPHSSDSLGKKCNTALKTSLGGSKTTFLPINLQ